MASFWRELSSKFWYLENLEYCCTEKIEILLYSSDVLATVKSSKANVVLRESLKWVFKAQSRDCGATSLFHKSPTICIYGQMHSRPFIWCLYLSLYLLNAKLPLLFVFNVLYIFVFVFVEFISTAVALVFREAPSSNVLFPYGHCPNSFRISFSWIEKGRFRTAVVITVEGLSTPFNPCFCSEAYWYICIC